jgi:phosphohistidine swiveling domain-containing protein
MSFTLEFKHISKHSAASAGGKGASLGEMTQAGIPVPPGFVVLAGAFEQFLKETDLNIEIDSILHSVNHQEMHTVEHASEKIQKLILEAKMPEDIAGEIESEFKKLGAEYVAVRSSATAEDSASAAWAGQLDSFLNTTEETLLENVQKCWASLFTPRAVFYRFEKGLHDQKISVAVVIQKMVNSEKSGIAFSVHPVTEDPNQLIIEAGFGLGEAIVSGQITPDSYVVEKNATVSEMETVGEKGKKFKKEDYILSFWAQGVSVFVTDIHLGAYKALEVLYIIDHGMFKQYFTKIAYERALDRGLMFYSDEHKFDNYRKNLSRHRDVFKEFFESEIKYKSTLSRDTVISFFECTKKLCGEYAQMNFESTDKAFLYQEENPIIKKNLVGVAEFKDRIRTVMNMVLFEPGGYSEQFFSILGKQFDLSPELFSSLTQQEILNLFEGNKPNEAVVSKRQDAFVESFGIDGFYEGKNTEAILAEFKEEAVFSEVFSGQTASKGKITGKVKIIPVDYSNLSRVNAEIEKMQQGDILIAETTAPELMVACKKAGAIVTDMGGLMSHAAIISREFGIPCIVGTKIATKVLHDSDLVEVDADNGVVRIIEKAKP